MTKDKAMKDIRSLLTDADPVRAEPGLSDADAVRMRRAVLSSTATVASARVFWPRAIAIAAVVLLMVMVGTQGGRRLPLLEKPVSIESAAVPAEVEERRQLQFATPGGTRIIWTLDPNFKVGETVP